jgi:hypothetical protein
VFVGLGDQEVFGVEESQLQGLTYYVFAHAIVVSLVLNAQQDQTQREGPNHQNNRRAKYTTLRVLLNKIPILTHGIISTPVPISLFGRFCMH